MSLRTSRASSSQNSMNEQQEKKKGKKEFLVGKVETKNINGQDL